MPDSSIKPFHLSNRPKTSAQVHVVLNIARRLHRSVKTGSIARAMPILRRLKSVNCPRNMSLKELYANKHELKRKYFICLLANEAGFHNWEAYRAHLNAHPNAKANHGAETIDDVARLKCWFSKSIEAENFVKEVGGHVVTSGEHAFVNPDPRGNC